MAKKAEMMEEVATVSAPLPVMTNFGREDLNELRDAVNFLLSRET